VAKHLVQRPWEDWEASRPTGGAGLSVGKRDFHSGREKAGHMRERREGGGVRSNFNGAGGLLRMCHDGGLS